MWVFEEIMRIWGGFGAFLEGGFGGVEGFLGVVPLRSSAIAGQVVRIGEVGNGEGWVRVLVEVACGMGVHGPPFWLGGIIAWDWV